MTKIKWQKGKLTGVRFYSHETRKHGVKFDRYFSGSYQIDGKRFFMGFGWASEGIKEETVYNKLIEFKSNAKSGKGPTSLKEEVEARKEQQSAKEQLAQQKEKDQKNIHDFLYNVYIPQIRKEKKARTTDREESLFRNWIDGLIGQKLFNQITKSDIENIFYNIIDSGKSIRTAEYCLTTLKQIWREAISNGYAGSMPEISKTIKKRISSNDNQRLRYLSHDEAGQLLTELKKISTIVFEQAVLSLHCGFRAGEILSLTWGCINVEKSEILIIDAKGKDRTVIMTKTVKGIFSSKTYNNPLELVFPGRTGQSNQISQTFTLVANKLFNQGITDRRLRVTFHSLRHTCASWMVKEGLSLYLVQKVLGHSTIQVTERYSHLAPNQLQLAADTIERSIKEDFERKIIPFNNKNMAAQ